MSAGRLDRREEEDQRPVRVQRLDGADVLDVNPEFTQNGTAEPHTDGAAVHGGASKRKDTHQICTNMKTNMNENMEKQISLCMQSKMESQEH